MSGLRLAEAAHITARAAWLHPDDHEQRVNAVQACAAIGIDYIACVAHVMESRDVSADHARREVAEALRAAADNLYEEEAA